MELLADDSSIPPTTGEIGQRVEKSENGVADEAVVVALMIMMPVVAATAAALMMMMPVVAESLGRTVLTLSDPDRVKAAVLFRRLGMANNTELQRVQNAEGECYANFIVGRPFLVQDRQRNVVARFELSTEEEEPLGGQQPHACASNDAVPLHVFHCVSEANGQLLARLEELRACAAGTNNAASGNYSHPPIYGALLIHCGALLVDIILATKIEDNAVTIIGKVGQPMPEVFEVVHDDGSFVVG
uniref:SERPIN domain-containing protein n=1 Tax=Globodera pallida TaxID=36090 RepID=A0A183C7U6_GLOPA